MGVNEATEYAQSLFNKGRAAITRELIGCELKNTDDSDSGENDALLALIEWLWARKK